LYALPDAAAAQNNIKTAAADAIQRHRGRKGNSIPLGALHLFDMRKFLRLKFCHRIIKQAIDRMQ
jgi:hypothetical protein